MQILTLQFLVYNYCGLWRPSEWSSNVAKLLYNVFTFVIISSEYFVVLTQFMDIVLIVDNINDFATNTLIFLTLVAVCCKATVVLMRRNAIINLMQLLMKAPCKPCDKDESAIQTKFDRFIRSYSIKYLVLGISAVAGTTIGSVLNVMQGHIPYRIWLPWDYNIPLVFWIISIHQIISSFFATMIVRYLEHALSSSNKDRRRISDCIHHHLSIYKYAEMVNAIFNQVFFVQFSGSILVLCTSVYYLSTHIAELSGLVTLLFYTIGMFVQIYILCWSGNEVILKSTSVGNAIYCMDWPLLSINEQRDLLLIMMRSTIPIKFTSSFLITLSLQSYGSILKMSYTAFNVLQK
ncbi:putative odorant receptor 71a isoform X2 [Temnothorax longispinosus]|uniref:putative odorant receptor 71a isoform X2 n=1 Tax=Temnothorax longispinosus TaxID=300112 RepID=UPI003A9A1AE0